MSIRTAQIIPLRPLRPQAEPPDSGPRNLETVWPGRVRVLIWCGLALVAWAAVLLIGVGLDRLTGL